MPLRISRILKSSPYRWTGIIPGFDNRLTQPRPDGSSDVHFFNDLFNTVWNNVIGRIFLILGALALLYIIWAGIQYIAARGDAAKTKQARQSILHIFLAVILITAAYAIIGTILSLARFLSGG
jgi:hypothetical protein